MNKSTLTALTVAILTAATFTNETSAQGNKHNRQQTIQVQQHQNQQLLVDPGFNQPTPKLGFQGQMMYGFGMKVVSVNWGTVAQRIGLETGDIITRINGRKISSQFDYDQALRDAARFNNGRIKLKIRNVRFDWGYHVPEFAFTNTVLDGFYAGPIGPVGPQVAARTR